jgi:hypothetical protein
MWGAWTLGYRLAPIVDVDIRDGGIHWSWNAHGRDSFAIHLKESKRNLVVVRIVFA